MVWAKEWEREGVWVDWQKLLPPRGFVVLARRWWSGRDRLDRPKQEDELRDYERLAATSEAFIYGAMSRLMLRRLARS